MAEHKKDSLKMVCTGMALGVASDIRPQGKFKFLNNIRVFEEGVLESRPRLNPFLTCDFITNEPPHSIKTIINKIDDSFLRIAGKGTKIFTGAGAILATKDSGWSGKPLFMVDFRPEEAVESYVYLADENKFRKISVSNVISDVGIVSPTKPVNWAIGKPERKIVDAIEAGSEAAWNNLTGSASAPTLETRVNTTILAYISDGVLPNFVSVVPTAFTQNIQRGAILKINGVDIITIDDVIPAALNTGVATIAKISYDVGTTGLATIVLSIPTTEIKRDSILLLNGTEYARVQDVSFDDKGIPSIRISTVGTFAAGNTVSGVASFRYYTSVAHAAAQTITASYIKSIITALGISSITRTFNVDLTQTGTKTLTANDVLHISLLPSDPAAINEIQIQLDVNSGAQNFIENYFYYVINPNFFTGSANQTVPTISVIQQALQRQQLIAEQRQKTYLPTRDYPYYYDTSNPYIPDVPDIPGSPIETSLGQLQWKELEIPIKDLIRVGSDVTRTLKDIKAIRISVNAKAAIDISIDSIWVGGADPLSTNELGFLPYNYVWRMRNPATKEPSNWSPPLRTGIKLSRGKVVLNFPDAQANYPADYKIDIARFGGNLTDFRIVGSIKNDGTSYTDNSSDRLVADNALAGRLEGDNINAVFDYYKPFAVLDTPKTGIATIIGTKFIRTSGDVLDISYPRGTEILINGIANSFYSNPSDVNNVELEIDRGSLVAAEFEIKSPLLTGQALPVVFGPFGEGNFGLFFFGLGYKKAAGTLYWLDGNSPGTMSDLNSLEITSPSEPLLTGVIYDGFGYVWTTRRSFQLQPTFNGQSFGFIARENANSRGVFSRYAIAVGRDYIYHLTENADGIVRVQGNGNPQYITQGALDNLFYNNGRIPTVITLVDGTIVYPPDFTKTDDLRFFYTKDYLFFRFIDTNNKQRILVFDEGISDWISYDNYAGDKINSIYHEEKESSAIVLAGIPDGFAKFENVGVYENTIESKIIPFAYDAGDSRTEKLFDEVIRSVDQGLLGFTYTNYYDDGLTNDLPIIIPGDGAHRRQQFVGQINSGKGFYRKNLTTVPKWNIASGVKLYEDIIYFIPQADITKDRTTDIEYGEGVGSKLWQGVIIEADTFNLNKTLQYYDDRNVLKASLTIKHNGKETISYSFANPFISHWVLRTSIDTIDWLPQKEVYVYDVEPESATVWEGEFNTHNLPGPHLIMRMAIAYRSTAEAKIRLTYDSQNFDEYILPSSVGNFKVFRFFVVARKWDACKYRIYSTQGIRIYKKVCEVWIKNTSSQSPFISVNPFGGESSITEITI